MNSIRKIELENPDSEYRYIAVSIGIATMIPDKNDESSGLIRRADSALYQSEADRHDCIRIFGGKT